MKKITFIASFVILAGGIATAQTTVYNTELLADPGFESSEGTFGNYYWNEGGNISFVSNDNTTNYFEAGTQDNGGLFSMKYEVAGNGTTQFADMSLNDARNDNDNFSSNQSVNFNATGSENVSYNAGDEVQFSLDVYIDNWDTNSGSGIEMRLIFDDVPGPGGAFTAETTSRINSPTGSWQTISATRTFNSPFTGRISAQIASETNAANGDTNLAWIDNASIQVVPEPSAFALVSGLLGLGCVLIRRRR